MNGFYNNNAEINQYYQHIIHNNNKPAVERTLFEPEFYDYRYLDNSRYEDQIQFLTNQCKKIHDKSQLNQHFKKHQIAVLARIRAGDLSNMSHEQVGARMFMLMYNLKRAQINEKLAVNSYTKTGRALYATSTAFHGAAAVTSLLPRVHITTALGASFGGHFFTFQGNHVEKTAINSDPDLIQRDYLNQLAELQSIAKKRATEARAQMEYANAQYQQNQQRSQILGQQIDELEGVKRIE